MLFNASKFEGAGHHFKLRATIATDDNFAFPDVVFLDFKIVMTFGANKLVPVR